MLTHCWIARNALEELFSEARRWLVRETGGALLGWRDGKDVVVQRVLGSGPRARHGFSHFEPDANWQGERGREIYAQTGRTVAYVGDWHTHPRGAPIPSRQDKKVMSEIAEDDDFRAPNPLSAILGRSWIGMLRRRQHELVVYVWDGMRLVPVDTAIFDGD